MKENMGKVTARIRVENWLDAEMLAAGARKEAPRAVETDALVDTFPEHKHGELSDEF